MQDKVILGALAMYDKKLWVGPQETIRGQTLSPGLSQKVLT